VQVLDSGEVWFTVENAFNSVALNTVITPGDILSEHGTIVRSNSQLLVRFNPLNVTNSIPIVSMHVWPSGEIWFCAKEGFAGANGFQCQPGDLLSDQGDVVFRGPELLSGFAPVPSGTNLALDALYIVTDAIPAGVPPPQMDLPRLTNSPPSSIVLSWRGQGRVFQAEGATNPAGPFAASGPLSPDATFIDSGAQTNFAFKYYRVQQW